MDKYPYGEEKPLESLYFACSGMKNDWNIHCVGTPLKKYYLEDIQKDISIVISFWQMTMNNSILYNSVTGGRFGGCYHGSPKNRWSFIIKKMFLPSFAVSEGSYLLHPRFIYLINSLCPCFVRSVISVNKKAPLFEVLLPVSFLFSRCSATFKSGIFYFILVGLPSTRSSWFGCFYA